MKNKILLVLILICSAFIVKAQNPLSFRDSLDNKLDLSDWVITANGFIPIPYLITEPALGGIGGALLPVFIDVNTPYLDSINGELIKTRAKPNLYGGGAAYTANGTWMVVGFAIGTIKKYRLNYRIGTAYADVNLEFYRVLKNGEEHSFEFNIQTFPVFGQLIKHFKGTDWFAGINYMFMNTELKRTNPEYHTPKEVNSNVSRLGVILEYDKRDNVFTPDKGFRWNTIVAQSAEAIGSDYNFTATNSAAFLYVPVTKRIIGGFRGEYQQTWGEAPFYLLPYINMRGIPTARYQGNITGLAETEWRFDFARRFSMVAFGGMGKAIQTGYSWNESKWHYSGGAGARYLIARKLKLRAGLDLARGPEQWAYYIVFGTTWVK